MTSPRPTTLTPFLLALAIAGAGVAAGCAGQGDVDRTQPDRIDKAIFFDKATGQPKVWYYRDTDVDVPVTSNWTFEGMQRDMDKVRFVITENFLIGYRAYDYANGAENDFTGGANNTSTPVLQYKILSHFDVKREYNPATGEQTNVISENTNDRLWNERQYMRVDWAVNLADPEPPATGDSSDPNGLMVTERIATDWWVSQTDTKNPNFADRPIFTNDTIDFVAVENRTPDYAGCMTLYPPIDDGGPWNCKPAQIKVRHSLRAVKASTYEPLDYPDNKPLLDANGKPIQLLAGAYPCSNDVIKQTAGQYSGDDCTSASVGAFSKFGFFRTVRQGYDRRVGATEAGRQYFANRWNIWEETVERDADGKPVLGSDGKPKSLSYGRRTPKPITFYTNVEFPDDPLIWNEAQLVAKDWSDALRKTVAALILSETDRGATISPSAMNTRAMSQPEMVVLKRNSCNLTDLKAYLDKYGDVSRAVEDATGMDAEDLDKAHLKQACSVAEAFTENLKADDAKKFSWQRNGDLRYSFFHWVDRPQVQGPLGYGPSSADPETGEIVSASLYLYGAALDVYAQQAKDTVDLLTGGISVDNLLSGKTITDVLKETSAARQARDAKVVSPEAKAKATAMLGGSPLMGSSKLRPRPAGAPASNLQAIKGTPIERLLVTQDIIAAKLPELGPGSSGTLTEEQFNRASPVNWLSDSARAARFDRQQKLAMRGCVYMGEFADDGIIGLALELKDKKLSGDELFKELRRLIFRGLADHEMGHTMGLRHNFSGSADAMNYADQYWQIRSKLPRDQWADNRIAEYQYSTVMDYGARFNSDVQGLGKYDLAAIRFGYGQLIDMLPPGALVSGVELSNHVFLDDYSKLPTTLGGVNNLADGGVSRYDFWIEELSKAYAKLPASGGGFDIPGERPYKFCSDEYVGNLDCKRWDFGANQREIISDTIDRYKNYYFFQAFKRGRLNWSLNGYMNRLLDRYFGRFTEAFQFYYFFGDYLAQYDLGSDLLKASVDSLNALAEVLQTPEPGMHCTTQVSPDVMVLPDPSGANACASGEPVMNIEPPTGKPYYINFSDDYYYRVTRAGSLYEKLAALVSLTSTEARFFRVDTFADANNYSINYYRLFKDEMLGLLGGVIKNDPAAYGGFVAGGRYQPTPVVDLDIYGRVTYETPTYQLPATKRVESPVNKTIQYYALALSLSTLNSTWDSTLDIADYMAVRIKGSNDDVQYGAGTTVHEFTHPQSGQTYRAPQFDARTGIGVQLVDELNMMVGTKGATGTVPTKFGLYKGQPLPNWQTAKANLDAAKAAGDQAKYNDALVLFQALDYMVSYRVDLLDDLREFRRAFGY